MELKLLFKFCGYDSLVVLLIVPYGIEIDNYFNSMDSLLLLIVPYGIEILCARSFIPPSSAFNRTLWN